MSTTRITVSMQQELHDRMARFDRNWSAIARKSLEQEVRICEAMADLNRSAALQEKAAADCSDVRAAGLEDSLNYPIEEIEYSFLRKFEERSRGFIENADPENITDVFDRLNHGFHEDGRNAFRLRINSLEYKLGFIDGVERLKRIADGFKASERPARPVKSLFKANADTTPANKISATTASIFKPNKD